MPDLIDTVNQLFSLHINFTFSQWSQILPRYFHEINHTLHLAVMLLFPESNFHNSFHMDLQKISCTQKQLVYSTHSSCDKDPFCIVKQYFIATLAHHVTNFSSIISNTKPFHFFMTSYPFTASCACQQCDSS